MKKDYELFSKRISNNLFFFIKEKALQEQDEIFQGSDREPTMEDLKRMKYLERCMKESLRLYPSVPMIARRLTEDLKLGKMH